MEEAGSDSNPKYLNELFILLQVVLLCQEVAKLKCFSSASVGRAQLWDPFKAALTVFTAKGLGKQKDLKKNHTALARLMGLALDETITAAADGPSTTTKSSLKKDTTRTTAAAKSTTKNNGSTGESGVVVGSVMTTTKKTKSNRPGDKEKIVAKKKLMVDHRPLIYYKPTPPTTALVGRIWRQPSTERMLKNPADPKRSI